MLLKRSQGHRGAIAILKQVAAQAGLTEYFRVCNKLGVGAKIYEGVKNYLEFRRSTYPNYSLDIQEYIDSICPKPEGEVMVLREVVNKYLKQAGF